MGAVVVTPPNPRKGLMQNLSTCSMATTLKAEFCLYRCESCKSPVPAVGFEPFEHTLHQSKSGFHFQQDTTSLASPAAP